MAINNQSTTILLKDELKTIIEERLKIEMGKEFDEAIKRFNEKKGEIVAGVLVDVMGIADMEMGKDRIIFTIRSDKKLND